MRERGVCLRLWDGGDSNDSRSGKHGNARPPEYYDDPRKMKVASAEPNLKLFISTHGFDVEMKDKKIVAVMGRHIKTNEVKRFPGKFFVDCTGDGTIGFLGTRSRPTSRRRSRSAPGPRSLRTKAASR